MLNLGQWQIDDCKFKHLRRSIDSHGIIQAKNRYKLTIDANYVLSSSVQSCRSLAVEETMEPPHAFQIINSRRHSP